MADYPFVIVICQILDLSSFWDFSKYLILLNSIIIRYIWLRVQDKHSYWMFSPRLFSSASSPTLTTVQPDLYIVWCQCRLLCSPLTWCWRPLTLTSPPETPGLPGSRSWTKRTSKIFYFSTGCPRHTGHSSSIFSGLILQTNKCSRAYSEHRHYTCSGKSCYCPLT